MRSVLIPLALVALIGHSWAEEQAAPTGGLLGGRLQGVVEPRLAANAIRIHDLEKHIEKLKTRIEEAKHVDPERFLHDLQARLDTIEGNHCDDHEFQCGGSGQECVSDLFVCDGHKDCHNGHDEDKDVCDASAIRAGKTFSGITHWKDCLQLNDHTSHLTILGTRKAHFFTSRIGVHAVVTSEYKQKNGEEKKRHFEFHGGYNFANRRLYLIPKYEYGQAHMALACIFDHGDFERLDCTIETEASQHVCAESHLTLQHHGYDNDDDDDHDHHDDDDHHGDDDHDKDAGHLHDDDHDDDDHKSHRGHRKSHGDH